MSPTQSGGTGAFFAGGMEACWMLSGLWLLEARAAPAGLPVPGLMLGLLLAIALWRLTRSLSPPLHLSAGLAGGVIWALGVILFSASPVPALPEPAWMAGSVRRLLLWHGAPNATQLTAVAAVAIWFAGLRLGALRGRFDQLLGEFQFGLPILLFILFCASQWNAALPPPAPVVFSFFTFFLLGMAAARGGQAGSWLQGNARASWLAVLIFNAALVLGAGLLLGAAVTPGILKAVLGLLETMWDAMIEWVARVIAFLARLIPPPEMTAQPMAGGAGLGPQERSSIPELLRIPDYVRQIAGFIVSAFWMVLIGVCLWRMATQIAGWLGRRMGELDGAEVETLRGAFRQDLWRLLRWVRRRLRGWIAWLGYALGRKPPADSLPAEAAAVRRLYHRLLAWSAAGGCPRQRHQTPHEFLGPLGNWLPEARAKLDLITAHYTGVRYGGRCPDADRLKLLESTWQDVRHLRKKTQRRPKSNRSSGGKDS